MTIETKFDIDEIVWIIIGDTPCKVIIEGIHAYNTFTLYEVRYQVLNILVNESEIFPTKQELLENLKLKNK